MASKLTSAKLFSSIVSTLIFLFASGAWADSVSPDLAFGNGGLVTSARNTFRCLVKRPDGKIIVGGSFWTNSGASEFNSYDFVMIRYIPDGSLDNSFNGNGMVITDFDEGSDYGNAISLQSSGKIVLAGTRLHLGKHELNMALARYNPDGSLDNSFGVGSKLLFENFNTTGVSYSKQVTEGKQPDEYEPGFTQHERRNVCGTNSNQWYCRQNGKTC